MNKRYLFAGILVAICLYSAAVFAAPVIGLESIAAQFESETAKWVGPILNIAKSIFWTLAIFEMILCFGKLAIQGTDFSEVTIELFRRILILSFGWWLLSNPWVFWNIISGFLDAAALAMGHEAKYRFNVSKIMSETIVLVEHIYALIKNLGITQLPEILMMLLAAGIILWGLSSVSIQMVMITCEMYLIVVKGLLMLSLYSLEMTREYPMKFFGGLIGIGIKLFSLQLIIGLGFSLIKSWTALGATDVMSYIVMAGAAIGFKELAVKIPDYMQSLFSGSPGSGLNASGAVAAAGAVAAVAAMPVPGKGVAGAVMSISEAAKLGKVQGTTGMGRVGATVKNLGKAAIGVGQEGASNTIGGRMGAFNRAKALERAANQLGGESKD